MDRTLVIRRILFLVVAVSGLAAMIVYSQRRTRPDFVSGILEAEEVRVGRAWVVGFKR
jgi:hypothetical protein